MPEHSKTVRGTLSNPKTQALLKSNIAAKPPQLGDATSLTAEQNTSSANQTDSSSPTKNDARTPGDVYGLKDRTDAGKEAITGAAGAQGVREEGKGGGMGESVASLTEGRGKGREDGDVYGFKGQGSGQGKGEGDTEGTVVPGDVYGKGRGKVGSKL